jgi:stage II sporulation protein P
VPGEADAAGAFPADADNPPLPGRPDIGFSLGDSGVDAVHLPDPIAYESVIPGIRGLSAPAAAGTAVSITGEGDGYTGSGTVYIRNETDYDIDPAALLKKSSPVKLSGTGVQVLIMHTHGTEAYTPDAENPYTPTDTDRTTDPARNMLRVGDEITRILEQNGVKTLHSTALNDYPAYNGSYNRALEDIAQFMKDNPSIKVVIDVHRDAMIAQSGAKYKTVADIDGKRAAQLMFVVGTDAGGRSHDNWRENLTFQALLHDRMNTKYPGIMRPISIRTGRFNQHVTTGSMLLEVGTSGNTLPEALYSAGLFAQELADMLNGK